MGAGSSLASPSGDYEIPKKLGSRAGVANSLTSPRGKYEIIKNLGSGAFGDVYLANYKANGTSESVQVAVKEIARINDEREKAKREGELLKKISESTTSEHIVKYIDAFEGETGKLYISMQYCSRGDLAGQIEQKISAQKSFDMKVIYNYIYQIADGIDELHTKHNIVHRDLKPDNVLVAYENGKEVLKISDFGLAKVINYQTAMSNYPKWYGTPFYWAPEQDAGNPCRFPVDIWAIGIIFYELCIAPKSMEDDIDDIRNKINKGQQLVLPQRFPREDVQWLNQMVTKNPDNRMSSGTVYGTARGKPF